MLIIIAILLGNTIRVVRQDENMTIKAQPHFLGGKIE